MRRIGIIALVVALLIAAVIIVQDEQQLTKERKHNAEQTTQLDMLKADYKAQTQILHNSGKAFVQASQKIVALEAQDKAQADKIADLERQVASARSSRSSRGGARSVHLLSPAQTLSKDFWYNLSWGCECRSGHCENSGGFFQFKGSTATKVGYVPGQSYDQQKQEAIWWAGELEKRHVSPGSTSGWPHCWWEAKRLTAAAA